MNLSSIIEIWDSVLYFFYNICAQLKWILFDSIKYRHIVRRNKDLKNKHVGDTCYLVLNGPSIKKYDLTVLKGKIVFCTNYFYRSDLAKKILPNYICWQDSNVFKSDEGELIKKEIEELFPSIKIIFNIKGYKSGDNVYYTYNKHMPSMWGISNNISENCSAFSTVALYAINVAMYMGFTKIYVLGLDFEPGGFKHFTNLGENTECDNPREMDRKEEVCSEYWAYSKAHFEAYALDKYARNHNCEIVNLNPNSYIRAFRFGRYEDIFNATEE